MCEYVFILFLLCKRIYHGFQVVNDRTGAPHYRPRHRISGGKWTMENEYVYGADYEKTVFVLNDSSANMVTAKFLFAPPNTSIF